jgi:hypothetical protein
MAISGFQELRASANATLAKVEPVTLVLVSVATWIILSSTSSVLHDAYVSVSEKGLIGTISGLTIKIVK